MALHFTGEKENTEYQLITKGTYEVVLNCEWRKNTNNNEPYINCIFTIRTDITQDFGGRKVFDAIYKSKTTGEFLSSKINGLLSVIPNAQHDFEDYDELIQYLNGKTMRVEVEIQKADTVNYPNSKDKNVIKYLSYTPSQVNNPAIFDGIAVETEEIDDLGF